MQTSQSSKRLAQPSKRPGLADYQLPITLSAAQKEILRLRAALRECESEIDAYIWQEYPGDHPVHERYRQRDFSANPARIALKEGNQ